MNNWDLDEYQANDLYILSGTRRYSNIIICYYTIMYRLLILYMLYVKSFHHRSNDDGLDTYCDA